MKTFPHSIMNLSPAAPRCFSKSLVLPVVAGLILLLLSAAGAGKVQAQAQRQITFDEAVRIALEQNITLKRVANSVELQGIGVSRERMNFFPDLSLSSRGQQNYGRNFIQSEGEIVNQTTENLNMGVSSSVNLFNGFGDVASLRQAQLQAEASELDYDRARQTVVFTVISNYLELIEQREQVRVLEENLESQNQQLAQIEAFTEVGARPISDLYQQQAAVASAELDLLNAQRAYQISEVRLIQTLQLDPFQAYEFVAPEVDDLELTAQQYELETLLRSAFERRADLRAEESSIAAAHQGIRAARSSYWPQVNFSAGYGTNYTTAAVFRGGDQDGRIIPFWDQLNQSRGGSVGLSLSLPIFDRFSTRNNIQQARVQYDNARLALEEQQQDIAVQVRQAYLDYATAEKSLDVTEKQLRAADLALEAARERYNVGAATLVELSQAQAEYVRASSARVRARYDFLFQEKLIGYYVGVLDPREPLF